MASKGTVVAAVLVVAILLGAGAWVLIGSSGDADSATNVTDALGRSVNIETKPETIVSCSPSITEMVYELDKGDALVGVTTYCDYPQDVLDRVEAGTLKTIGGFYSNIDTEGIITLNPGVVFLDESVTEQVNMIPKLEQAGIRAVVLFDATNSTMIYENLEIMGEVLHEKSAADSAVSTMENKFEAVSKIVGESEDKPTVMIVVWWSSTTIYVAGSGSFTDEIITDAGGVNAFADKTSYAKITLEDIVHADPDIIVLTGMAQKNVNYAMDQLNNGTVLTDVPAVVNGEIYVLLEQAENTFLRSGVRMVEGTYLMAMMIYPDKFNKELPHSIGDDYEEYLPMTW